MWNPEMHGEMVAENFKDQILEKERLEFEEFYLSNFRERDWLWHPDLKRYTIHSRIQDCWKTWQAAKGLM